MLGRFAFVLGLLGLLVAPPLTAGTVYVALSSDTIINGTPYETEIKVTNPAGEEKLFTAFFIPSDWDSTARAEELELPVQRVPAGATRVYRGLNFGAPNGMLELTSAADLHFTARLIPKVNGGETVGITLPVISSDNLFTGGQAMQIVGLRRDDMHRSGLGIVNLSKSLNPCNIKLIGAGGGQLISPTTLVMPPLSQFFWQDVLGLVAIAKGSEIRAEIMCEKESYAFGTVLDTVNGHGRSLLPAEDGKSLLTPPGVAAACPSGAVCFNEPGIFHQPRPGNEVWIRRYVMQPGLRYRQLRVKLKVTHGGWDRDQGGLHNFFWLARNEWKSNTFGYVNARGGNKSIFQNTTNVDIKQKGVTQRTPVNVKLIPGTTYEVDYTYDAAAGRITTILTNAANGNEVARIIEPATINGNRIVTQGEGFFIECALKRVYQEVPTYGWQYADLEFQLIP